MFENVVDGWGGAVVARGAAGIEQPVSMLEEDQQGQTSGDPLHALSLSGALRALGNPCDTPKVSGGKLNGRKEWSGDFLQEEVLAKWRIPLGLWMSGSERVMYQMGTLGAQA